MTSSHDDDDDVEIALNSDPEAVRQDDPILGVDLQIKGLTGLYLSDGLKP